VSSWSAVSPNFLVQPNLPRKVRIRCHQHLYLPAFLQVCSPVAPPVAQTAPRSHSCPLLRRAWRSSKCRDGVLAREAQMSGRSPRYPLHMAIACSLQPWTRVWCPFLVLMDALVGISVGPLAGTLEEPSASMVGLCPKRPDT